MATLPINPVGGARGGPVQPSGAAAGGGSQVPQIPIATTPPSTLAPTANPTNPLANPTAHAATPGAIPTGTTLPGAAVGGVPGAVSISSGLNTTDGSNTLTGDFKDSYGNATGTALAGVLGSLGTATNGAVAATNSAIEADAAKSQANIDSQLAAAGISPNSSASALEKGDFASSLSETIGSTDAQMELSEENTLISSLQSEGQTHGPSGSTLDSVLSGFETAGSIAGAIFGL